MSKIEKENRTKNCKAIPEINVMNTNLGIGMKGGNMAPLQNKQSVVDDEMMQE